MYLSEIDDGRAVRRIDMTPLERRFTDNLKMLVQLITSYGFKCRIVGGAVRDVLLGMEPRDIDMITDALPDAVMYILGQHDVHYVTKGIPHGTVKVKFADDEEYEITSIGYTVEDDCCPPTVTVHSGQSWKGDATRRDFTIDTMSLSFEGLLYDYLKGIQDLRKQYIRFIGDPAARIQKDPILIMRFFKLLSLFRDPKFDKAVLPILKDKMKLIKKIKPLRMQHEMSNIRRGQNADRVIKMMSNLGFKAVIDELTEEMFICEANLMTIVPAIKIQLPDQVPQYFVGQRGQTHADIWEQMPDNNQIDQYMESGFWDTETKTFLSRLDALRLVQSGESQHLAHLQNAQGTPTANII